jgi:hypothetical protein
LISIEPLTDTQDFRYVCALMRDADREEIFATRADDDDQAYADDCLKTMGRFSFIAFAADREPIASLGALSPWPGFAFCWAFGTDRWPEAILAMTKSVKRTMLPALVGQGIHRIEARALAWREDTARWMTAFGARREAILPGYGRHGEAFALYAWTAPQVAQDQPSEPDYPNGDALRRGAPGRSVRGVHELN